MKKTKILLTVLGCALMAITASSCMYYKDEFISDPSLAGWVSLIEEYRITEVEGSFGGTLLEDVPFKYTSITIRRSSDTSAYLRGWFTHEDDSLYIATGSFPLSGERTNVSFNHITPDGITTFNDIKNSPVDIMISGWVKAKDEHAASIETKSGPPRPEVLCEINIRCVIDGKELILKIKPINS